MPNLPEIKIDLSPIQGMGVNLDQYMGAWAIEPGHFSQLVSSINNLDLRAHVLANQGDDQKLVSQEYATTGIKDKKQAQVGIVTLRGTMTKRGSSMSSAGSMVVARQAIRALAKNDAIAGIMLVIDSPGGTVAGTADLADAVRDAGNIKPVYAFVEDLAASAAYWVASAATAIYANNETARIGSIGVFSAAYDLSRMAENDGIKTVVVKTGPLKGAGFPGAEITDEQIADWQSSIDKTFSQFLGVVAKGRDLSIEKVKDAATGGVFDAEEAQRLGLIDGIQSFDATLSQLMVAVTSRRKERGEMSAEYKDIVAACPGIEPSEAEDSQFICDQQAKGEDVETAAKNWAQTLKARAESAREEAANAKAEAEKVKAESAKTKPAPGVDPLDEEKGGSAYSGTAREEFNSRVESKMKAGLSRDRAVSAVSAADPDLRKAFHKEANEGR